MCKKEYTADFIELQTRYSCFEVILSVIYMGTGTVKPNKKNSTFIINLDQ